MNICNFIGRIGRDAVVRHTSNGKRVTGWALAVDSGFGENKQTTWIDCTLWGERGEKVADYIRKGDRIGVSGEIGTKTHNDKTYVTLNVRELTLLGEKRERPAATPAPASTDHGSPSLDDDTILFAPRGKRNHWE